MTLFLIGIFFSMFAVLSVQRAIDQTPEGKRRIAERNALDRAEAMVRRRKEAEATEMERERQSVAEKAAFEEKLQGCIGFFGQHSGLVGAVKEGLRDPRSFDHIETQVNLTSDSNMQMRFRAANGFGGLGIGVAHAFINPDTCEVLNINVENEL